ncbi:MAG TPA: glycerophosphodiester phosphodiesterase family protein [Leptospiraceae bacterium]|jgi:glycerophosphoryl diester phosphodiesterase|nr:hypothetical protein [Leptospirales bacterium]HMU82624.1 glycerophosphodiester phosphodiesterase family protein [Leptospiraceae bacterium]HMX58651.1 glycerophosphodiester phosphodiesterase family protein [Leptospiraceae bacterium]HMY44709.1 glycerophosphodiester phosphodiesterase family protein [Leptospiraceae bacterium]HMZ35844.1 glycerophosphodiester phosphodiesterase family protein [Leptospiraceae bacterium]
MTLRTIRLILFITLIPEVLILGFFVYARIQSPPKAGRMIANALGIPHPAVIAHRGASYLAPEETRAAYLIARDLGADYLEGDVQRTKDGILVLLHDDTLERTSNVAEVFPGRQKDTIDRFTYAELLKLDLGSWFNSANPDRANDRFKGLKIQTVEDLLAIAEGGNHRPGVYLETKSPERYPGVEKDLVDLLTKRGWIGRDRVCADTPALIDESVIRPVRVGCGKAAVIFQSFSAESVQVLKNIAATVPRVYLVDEEMGARDGWPALVEKARSLDAGMGPVGYLSYPWHTGPAHRAGRLVHSYTINKKWQLWLMNQFGSDGVFTDRSEMALAHFDRVPPLDTKKLIAESVF